LIEEEPAVIDRRYSNRAPLQRRAEKCMSPYRLRRLHRLFSERPVFFITVCTRERHPLLANAAIHETFEEFCRKAEQRGIYVGRYVMMPDHMHLFAAFAPEAATLAGWMKSLKNALSKSLREQGVASPHWQKGFFDHVLRSQESYAQKWAYVQLNPVRAGLASCAEDWPYQGEVFPLEF
jgi:REP-associated tyrosine transposase